MSALTRWQQQTVLAEVLGLDPGVIVADSLRVDTYLSVVRWTEINRPLRDEPGVTVKEITSDGERQTVRYQRDLSRDEVAAAIKAVQ